MKFQHLVLRGLRYYHVTGLLALIGIILAGAALTGSLLVGDSVRGSLRDTALQRLGKIDGAILSSSLFPVSLAGDIRRELNNGQEGDGGSAAVAPILLFTGSVQNLNNSEVIPNVTIIGIDTDFNRVFPACPSLPDDRYAVMNSALAGDLGIKPGDPIMATISGYSQVAMDSLFGKRKPEDSYRSMRLNTHSILPGNTGDFALDASNGIPRCLFVSRSWLASQPGIGDSSNCILLRWGKDISSGKAAARINDSFRKTVALDDFGLFLRKDAQFSSWVLKSRAITLTSFQMDAALQAAKKCTPVLHASLASIYLAKDIANLGSGNKPANKVKHIAYSVMAWRDDHVIPAIPNGSIVLNQWAADRLAAKPGDDLRVSYLSASLSGDYPEKSLHMKLMGTLPMRGAGADQQVVPEVPGITNADTISDWNPPFPIDLKMVTPEDETYWKKFRAAPKAYVSKDTIQHLWFEGPSLNTTDWVTSVIFYPELSAGVSRTQSLNGIKQELTGKLIQVLLDNHVGPVYRPLRKIAISSAEGTTDFGSLFLGMSFFLVLSALGFAAVILRLVAERRAGEAGIMLALGYKPRQAVLAIRTEGYILTFLGAALGIIAGAFYARSILALLSDQWHGAIGDTSLTLHVSAMSLAIGWFATLATGIFSVQWSIGKLKKLPELQLLKGQVEAYELRDGSYPASHPAVTNVTAQKSMSGSSSRLTSNSLIFVILCAVLIALFAWKWSLFSTAIAFFAEGALLLNAFLLVCNIWFSHHAIVPIKRMNMIQLSIRNMAVNRMHSLLIIGLSAGAVFILVAVCANMKQTRPDDTQNTASGSGGYQLVGISSNPLSYSPSDVFGLTNLGFSQQEMNQLMNVLVVPCLLSPGDDISCLNLTKPISPRFLGVSSLLLYQGGFSPIPYKNTSHPWDLLAKDQPDGEVPAFVDSESVTWNLHSGLGQSYSVTLPDGRKVKVRFVGILPNSIFAGQIIISDANFRRIFPHITAPSYFLISCPPGKENAIAQIFRKELGQMGLQVKSTREILNSLLGVQNAYLSAFLALGGFGMLLGTFGLVSLLFLNTFRRKSEYALQFAIGIKRRDIQRSISLEYGFQLAAGMAIGTIAAVIATLPELRAADADVNWLALSGALVLIAITGLAGCSIAARYVTSDDLIQSLRQE
jgi:ABC-type antimicrobial peptide transport system permease subunit